MKYKVYTIYNDHTSHLIVEGIPQIDDGVLTFINKGVAESGFSTWQFYHPYVEQK